MGSGTNSVGSEVPEERESRGGIFPKRHTIMRVRIVQPSRTHQLEEACEITSPPTVLRHTNCHRRSLSELVLHHVDHACPSRSAMNPIMSLLSFVCVPMLGHTLHAFNEPINQIQTVSIHLPVVGVSSIRCHLGSSRFVLGRTHYPDHEVAFASHCSYCSCIRFDPLL